MAKKNYHQDEDYPAGDPGNVLRRALGKIDAPDCDKAVANLLYTAGERNIYGDLYISVEDALTIWRLVEIARTADEDVIKTMRM